jgi:hypothetical protein
MSRTATLAPLRERSRAMNVPVEPAPMTTTSVFIGANIFDDRL